MLLSHAARDPTEQLPQHVPNSTTASTAVLELSDHGYRDQEPTSVESQQSPPDGGYGWVCVGTCFTVNCFTWGFVASYGVYLSYYLSAAKFPGSRPLDYAFIGGLNFAVAMLAAPVVTVLARKFGIHLPMLLGAAMLSGGLISASFASHIWHLYLSQGLLVGLGVGFVYIPSVAILSQWFLRRRSLANGISAAGSGIGGLIFSLAAGAMVKNIGIEWCLRVSAILTGVANTAAAIFIRDRNAIVRPPQLAFDIKLLCRSEVLLLLSWAFISMFGYITLLFSMSDYALSIGLSRAQAAQITAFLNVGTALGRPFIGVTSDRLGRIEIAGVLTLVNGLCCLVIWLPSASFGVTVFFALVSGAIFGVFWVTIGPLCAEVAGLKEVPSLLSLSWSAIVLPTALSEVIALQLRRSGNERQYLYPQIFCGLSYICASLCLWQLQRVKTGKLMGP